jgi:putative hemolysin
MLPDSPILMASILAILLVLDLLTIAARTAYSHTNLARLLSQREQEGAGMNRALEMFHKPETLESSLHLALLLDRFVAAAILFVILAPQVWTISNGLAFAGLLLLVALVLFLVEEGIEALVSRNAEIWAIRLAWFTRILTGVLSPVAKIGQTFKHGRQLDMGVQSSVTQDELISMLDAGQQEGVLEQDEREMIYSIFRLNDTLTREIMVPRIDITALDVNTGFFEAVDILLSSGHSRIPVYEETVDNIIGLIYAKDLLRAWRENSQTASLRPFLREVYFVPEAKKVDELLEEMQARQVHMGIVVDEYGGVAGLVTMEDIVEEIVGEIRDEYDQGEELPFQAVAEGEYVFLGRIDLDDFNNIMQTDLPREEAETLGGFIYSQVGRVPENGETLQIKDLELTVEQVSGRRIRKVRARRLPISLTQEVENEDHADDR